jgi:hypothetical protein
MKDWSYHFEAVSKATWVQQIERELKGKSLQSLYTEWWPGSTSNPVHHADDNIDKVNLPAYLFEAPPVILESIDARAMSSKKLNGSLLEALRFGADTILLQVDHTIAGQTNEWLKDVHADMVNWHIIKVDPGVQLHQLNQQAPGKVVIRIDMDRGFNNNRITSAGDETHAWCYTIPSSGNWVEQTAFILQQVLHDAKSYSHASGKNDFLPNCILVAAADTDYLKSLVQLRTLHVVWQNVLAKTGIAGKRGYLECHVWPEADEAPDNYLVRATTSSVAANLSGVPGLCIHAKPGASEYYSRINRNIHHLLHMESGLPKMCDPLAGAYAIDYYTAAWAKAIWEKLDGE